MYLRGCIKYAVRLKLDGLLKYMPQKKPPKNNDSQMMACDWLTILSTGVVTLVVFLDMKAKD